MAQLQGPSSAEMVQRLVTDAIVLGHSLAKHSKVKRVLLVTEEVSDVTALSLSVKNADCRVHPVTGLAPSAAWRALPLLGWSRMSGRRMSGTLRCCPRHFLNCDFPWK